MKFENGSPNRPHLTLTPLTPTHAHTHTHTVTPTNGLLMRIKDLSAPGGFNGTAPTEEVRGGVRVGSGHSPLLMEAA